jgi:glycosyltransferase involved in cell wall biosynthesis
MPVHNAMPHVDEAVRSILEQTRGDFEFIIFDDGSTDGSTECLRDWAQRDSRIRLTESKTNLGPVGSSKAVVELASGEIIARMDADDISHPRRFERQLQVLRERPDVGLVACVCDVIGASGEVVRGPDVWRLSRRSWFAPFAHGSAMFRREVFEAVGGYREACAFWEDQDLFVRMLAFSGSKVVTLPETLYRVRYSRVSTRVASDQRRVERAVDLMYRSVDRLAEGRRYDDLLTASEPDTLDPRVFIATGSLDLWADGKPRLFKRLLKEARLGPDFRSLGALVWTSWASLHPPSLRLFMKTLVNLRNALSPRDRNAGGVEWNPPGLTALRRQDFPMDRTTSEVH